MLHLKGISFIHTRASLARDVFSFKTFFDPRYRPHTPVLVKSEVSEVKVKVNPFLVL